jgi:polar amino acid transport system substrate-binding protein
MNISGAGERYPGRESGNNTSPESGRILTQGQRKMMKMVTPYMPVKSQHRKDMAGIVHLASEIAHYFNNILSVTTGYGDMLKMKMPKDDPSRAYVEKILASSRRAHDLVRGLFMFAGNERISLREVDLNRVVRRAARFLPPEADDGVEKTVKLNDNELFVMADVGRLEEALKSLIENALEAMPEGGKLTLRVENLAPGKAETAGAGTDDVCYASIYVTDTGGGMDEDTKERVFEPFFSTKGQARNTGLGLSKVYGIVKQHSGEVVVESSPGNGTSIKIYIPLVRVGLRTAEPISIPLPVSFTAGSLHVPGTYLGD